MRFTTECNRVTSVDLNISLSKDILGNFKCLQKEVVHLYPRYSWKEKLSVQAPFVSWDKYSAI